MRKLLLASVATLGTAGLMSAAYAQAPAMPGTAPAPSSPTQGILLYTPNPGLTLGANNNNNAQGPALPGPVANPTPGTMVIHIGGAVVTEVQATWTSIDKRVAAAPAGTIGGSTISPGTAGGTVGAAGVNSGATGTAAALGYNGAGTVSLNPQAIDSYARIYMGADGMATNGLRYGAGMEIRQNFSGQISNNGSTGASGYTSMETLFVRRAFTYVAGDSWGIVRLGQADGLWSLFGGPTSYQFLWTGNLNGGDLQNMQGSAPTFVFSNVAGNEYTNAKAVYLSPQIAGFDFGMQYAPNTSNGEGISAGNVTANSSLSGSGIGTGNTCTVANSGCPLLTSGPGALDGARSINQWAVGARYQGLIGGVGVYGWAAGEFSGHATYTGPSAAVGTAGTTTVGTSALGINSAALKGSTYTGNYKNLAVGQGGVNLSFAGFTFGGEVVGGNMNGQLGLQPQGGASLAGYLLGVKYVNGPFTAGIVGEAWWEQGNVQLSGLTQRRGRGLSTGVQYTVAPGFSAFAEYLWNDQKQNMNNFNPAPGVAANGSNGNNTFTGQGVLIGNVISW